MTRPAVPDVGLLIDDLAGAYQKSFGASRIGARERLNAAHLVDTLNRLDAEPDRVRGALRAALAKTKAEADLFDRIYPDASRREEPSPEPTPSPRPEAPAPESIATPDNSRKRLFMWLGIGAAVVAAVTVAFVLLSPKQDAPTPGPSPNGGTEPTTVAAITDTPGDSSANAGANAARASEAVTANTANSAYAEEVSAILDRASEFGYRPSPRELASVLASSFDMTEVDLTRQIGRSTAHAPDQPLDLFDISTLAAVHAALHGPVASDIRETVLPAAVVERAKEQTEYLTFADGRLVVHWREGDAWRERVLEGEVAGAGEASITVSNDRSLALTVGPQISSLWHLAELKLIASGPTPPPAEPGNLASAARGVLLPTNDAIVFNGATTLVLSQDGDSQLARSLRDFPVGEVAVSGSGSGFIVQAADGQAQLWESATRRLVRAFTVIDRPQDLALSDNLRLAIGQRGEYFMVSMDGSDDYPFSSEVSAPGHSLFVAMVDKPYITAFFAADDTRQFLNLGSVVAVRSTSGQADLSAFSALNPNAAYESAQRSEDGKTLFVEAAEAGTLVKYLGAVDASTGQLLSERIPISGLTSAIIIPDVPSLIALSTGDSDSPAIAPTRRVGFIPVSNGVFDAFDNEITIPDDVPFYLNIPSIAEASARATAFAETRKPKPLPDWPMWLAVAAPLLIAGFALAHPASWRRAYLSRRKIESDTLIRKLTANVTTFEPLAGERRAVGRLDQRLRQLSHRLDLRETVIATARAGGMFTPVPDTDAGTPEYVALIERRRLTDADAARMVAFFNRLRAAGLSLTLYTYSGTPEALTPLRGGHAIPIETLRQRHAGAFLLITGDSARFHNRKTGGAATWTSRIGPVRRPGQGRSFAPTWSGGAFLSREPMPRLGPAECAIERDLGLIVRHTDASDLTAIGEYFHGRSASLAPHDEEGCKPVPAYFAISPERLVEEEPPGVIERQDLAPQLEAWLGAEGLRWVRALAYYPIVQWDLALYLASILMPQVKAETRADMEAKVARLPWLEHGFMPEWVRQELVAGADPKEEKRIVREIVAVMAEAREGADGNISFQLMDPSSGASGDHSGDAIFIDAVARAKARPWDLPPPSQWLRRAPQALQMPWARMRIALAAVVLATAAAIFTPHSGNMAPLAQWTPVMLFGLFAMAMAVGPMLVTRYADRGRG